jgi:hypothetical protein
MRAVEHAIDIWDLREMDPRLNSGMLHEHLHDFADEGWELVWMSLNASSPIIVGPTFLSSSESSRISASSVRTLGSGRPRSCARATRQRRSARAPHSRAALW